MFGCTRRRLSSSRGASRRPAAGVIVLAVSSVLAGTALSGHAAINLYTNGGGTNTWEDPSNWISGALPGPNDDVYIDSNFTVSLNSDQTIGGELQIGLTANAYGRGNLGGPATLNLNAGTLRIGKPLVVGQGDGSGAGDSDGVFNIAAGATFIQSGGRVLIGFFGHDPNTTTSGTVNVYGTFRHENTQTGFHQVFHIGGNTSDNSFNEGTLNVYEGGVLDTGINGVQVGARGQGQFNIHGGTVNIPFYLSVGTGAGNLNGTAHVNIAGGALTVGEFSVNENNANTCTFTQTGGVINVTGTQTGTHTVRIGRSRNTAVGPNAAKGVYSISGGELNCPIGDIWVGEGNNGEMNVSGTAAVNVSGGYTLSLNNSNRVESIAVINQTGGAVTIADFGQTRGVYFGNNGSSIYNLDGGTLTTPRLTANGTAGTRLLAINGGKIIANAALAAPSNLSVSLGTTGGTIDTAAHNVTWDSPVGGGGALTKLGTGALILRSENNTFTGGVNVNAGTLLANNPAGSATGSGTVTVASDATLGGTGWISGATAVQGRLSPGDAGSVGALSLLSSLTFVDGAAADIQLAGAASYDFLPVTGTASLAGAIELSLAGGYDPAIGQTHRVLNAAGRTGQFATVSGHMMTSDKWLAVTYDATGVNVTAATPGDADLNAAVNFSDLLALAQNYNISARTWTTGDFNGNGTVEFNDLLALAQHYGQGALTSDAAVLPSDFAADWALAQSLVPEPAIVSLASLGLVPLVRRRR